MLAMEDIDAVKQRLTVKFHQLNNKADILKAPEFKQLFAAIAMVPKDERAQFGAAVNQLRKEFEAMVEANSDQEEEITPIDLTAPWDANTPGDLRPRLLTADKGSRHPIMTELDQMLDIFYRMGFAVEESRQIDDDYHMFGSLNFPEGHPARDDYDSFVTAETDKNDKPFVAPAHTSTMQNRVLHKYKSQLESDRPIAVVVPGRVFRNEDVDARHEHTFYQLEGIYVAKKVTIGNLMASLKTFMQEYYQRELELKTQPYYFPFTEPSFEFAISCPFCDKAGCHVCGEGWIELLGCGMIHPNVLREGGIDPEHYSGFAWGIGFMRMIMIKYNIEDIRHFQSGNLSFMRQFV